MSCGCAGGGTVSPPQIPEERMGEAMASQQKFGDAVLVEYTGLKAGRVSYRGVTGTIYRFAANEEPKYVDGRDAEMFSRIRDFRIVAEGRVAQAGEPVLTA